MEKSKRRTGQAGTAAANTEAPRTKVRAARSGARSAVESSFGDDRKQQLLEKAARLFGEKGYDNTSMRDIASAFGVLPGSLYHHFGSKDELFAAVYAQGVSRFIAAVKAAVEPYEDPWERLEAGCVAHLETLVAGDSSAAAVLADWSGSRSEALRAALVTERDRYEKLFSSLTDAVLLPNEVERRYFRLALLGSFNWALTWYHPGPDSPATAARQLLAVIRHGL